MCIRDRCTAWQGWFSGGWKQVCSKLGRWDLYKFSGYTQVWSRRQRHHSEHCFFTCSACAAGQSDIQQIHQTDNWINYRMCDFFHRRNSAPQHYRNNEVGICCAGFWHGFWNGNGRTAAETMAPVIWKHTNNRLRPLSLIHILYKSKHLLKNPITHIYWHIYLLHLNRL